MIKDENGKVFRRAERGTNVSIYFSRRNLHILDGLYDMIDAGQITSISQYVNAAVEDKWNKEKQPIDMNVPSTPNKLQVT